jgi:AcrR family transcriptional regulator
LAENVAVRGKRVRREPEEARLLILATAEKVMREEGYAAVTVRRVAKDAGVSSALLHYYYPTADDLLVALYRHSAQRDLEQLERALNAPDPIAAMWNYQTDPARTVLGVEFLALANHRKAIRSEIAQFATYVRSLQAQALEPLLGDRQGGDDHYSPECMSMLLTSISRNMIMESAVGISVGHGETRAVVEKSLKRLRDRIRAR